MQLHYFMSIPLASCYWGGVSYYLQSLMRLMHQDSKCLHQLMNVDQLSEVHTNQCLGSPRSLFAFCQCELWNGLCTLKNETQVSDLGITVL
jgi:hypothetical protein